ncbi:hypothetical protein ARMSODRAFT_880721 [Armillaria solidipes]|uniref:DUF2423 domain-containing protein n=1 Tax=Armillaria solidipes TaxID=1076256 RepID=A0A2H3C397_9AGAR|nr:hypothetical protein ARMSODRAFT_880721 [Armillaria solidipes]
MAKSLRSKTKRDFRSKKREDGIYAATEAARLHRLNAKLMAVISKDKDGDIPLEDAEGEVEDSTESMEVDTPSGVTRVSTHGRRGSRREEWRASKGLPTRPKSKGMNRQGGIAAVRKPGRSKRRR